MSTVDIRKKKRAPGFLPVSMISRAWGELPVDHEPRGMSPEQFVGRLAYYNNQFNCLHPLREGNAGWYLDWRAEHSEYDD